MSETSESISDGPSLLDAGSYEKETESNNSFVFDSEVEGGERLDKKIKNIEREFENKYKNIVFLSSPAQFVENIKDLSKLFLVLLVPSSVIILDIKENNLIYFTPTSLYPSQNIYEIISEITQDLLENEISINHICHTSPLSSIFREEEILEQLCIFLDNIFTNKIYEKRNNLCYCN